MRISNGSGVGTGQLLEYCRPVRPQDADSSRKQQESRKPMAAADYWLAEHNRVQAMLKQAEADRLAEQRQRRAKEQQDQQRAQARAIFEANEAMIDAEIDSHGFTASEKQEILDHCLETGRFDIESVWLFCQQMLAFKRQTVAQQTDHGRIAAVRARCTPQQWAHLSDRIRANSQPAYRWGWTQEQVNSGEAHEMTFKGLYE